MEQCNITFVSEVHHDCHVAATHRLVFDGLSFCVSPRHSYFHLVVRL